MVSAGLAAIFALSGSELFAQGRRTVIVSPRPGDPVRSGQRLLRRLDRIRGASAGNPWLLKVEPGIYDVGANPVVMKPFVDIEGSGEGSTVITGSGAPPATLSGAENSELRFIRVESRCGDRAVAIESRGAAFSLLHVTAVAADGASSSTAVQSSGADVSMAFVTARASGSFSSAGITHAGSGGKLKCLDAFASAEDIAYALFNGASEAEFSEVVAVAESGRFAGGIRNEGVPHCSGTCA